MSSIHQNVIVRYAHFTDCELIKTEKRQPAVIEK